MGAPRRNRKKFERPAAIWNKQRIESEHKLADTYGLKNLRELWKATSEIRRIRRNVREVLSGRERESVGKEMIARLARYNIVKEDAILDDLLVIKPENILERRLETIVHKSGLARSKRQARQLITHGFISVNGRRTRSPGYLVSKEDEGRISYYKTVQISAPPQPEAAAPAGAGEAAAAEAAEAKVGG